MGVINLAIIKTNARINLNKKIEGGIWRRGTMLIGKVVMKREDFNHHLETEVLHHHPEIFQHDPVNHQREVEFGLDKILQTTRTKFLTRTKRKLLKEPEILEAPDMKCHTTWIRTEFLFGLLGAKSL